VVSRGRVSSGVYRGRVSRGQVSRVIIVKQRESRSKICITLHSHRFKFKNEYFKIVSSIRELTMLY